MGTALETSKLNSKRLVAYLLVLACACAVFHPLAHMGVAWRCEDMGGGLSDRQTRAFKRRARRAVSHCARVYASGYRWPDSTEGYVVVDFSVGADGAVREIAIRENTMDNLRLKRETGRAFGALRFKALHLDSPLDATVRMVFLHDVATPARGYKDEGFEVLPLMSVSPHTGVQARGNERVC